MSSAHGKFTDPRGPLLTLLRLHMQNGRREKTSFRIDLSRTQHKTNPLCEVGRREGALARLDGWFYSRVSHLCPQNRLCLVEVYLRRRFLSPPLTSTTYAK